MLSKIKNEQFVLLSQVYIDRHGHTVIIFNETYDLSSHYRDRNWRTNPSCEFMPPTTRGMRPTGQLDPLSSGSHLILSLHVFLLLLLFMFAGTGIPYPMKPTKT